ncbi:hypothetical protein CesoFtcFv8_027565 [Champsocephalus esox]|uniref:Uncharacterized protein n=1 Tax=Champsocephalus esox TaxID=159716 RepID=A0AAN8AYX6_9TELE|nr:hypothetical protein CesoFtcFv8_027565 [Champsocephalus esox]
MESRSTLRPQRPLSAPSPRAAEPRSPATEHHSLLGMKEGEYDSWRLDYLWICCHRPLLLHYNTSSTAACRPELCLLRLESIGTL